MQLRGAADILQREQIERRIFRHKFDIIVEAGLAYHFDDRGPGGQQMCADSNGSRMQCLAKFIRTHVVQDSDFVGPWTIVPIGGTSRGRKFGRML